MQLFVRSEGRFHVSGGQVWQAWQVVAPRARQLYLYSDTDALIPPSEVHRFMALQACPFMLSHLQYVSKYSIERQPASAARSAINTKLRIAAPCMLQLRRIPLISYASN